MSSIYIDDKLIQDEEDIKILYEILELYKRFYPLYLKSSDKKNYFARENLVRYEYTDPSYTIFEDDDYLGYIICADGTLCLEDKFIKFMLLRYQGLTKCIEENINKEDKKDYLEYLQNELKKIKILYEEYQVNRCTIEISRENKIEFVKKICEAIEWSESKDNSSCSEISKNDLHPKTFEEFKQVVLGTIDSNYLRYKFCVSKFMGFVQPSTKEACDKTVQWNITLNKYSVLSAYYKKAPFIRIILIEGTTMPYRRYPSIPNEKKKGKKIGTLNFGPFKFSINYDKEKVQLIYNTGRYDYKKFFFYDENNFPIIPPLLRSTITTTYMEFKDFICYLNLPVFCSTVNRNMLFFPNYDLHQRLLEIQGLPKNFSQYIGRSIDWKWFKEDETAAKEAITCFCEEFRESEGYGIEPVQYEWYEIDFKPNKQKHIFRVCSMQEYLKYYKEQNYLFKNNKCYVYNDFNKEQVNALLKQFGLEEPKSITSKKKSSKSSKSSILSKPSQFHEKYLKYKTKYLNLKKLLQKIKNNNI